MTTSWSLHAKTMGALALLAIPVAVLDLALLGPSPGSFIALDLRGAGVLAYAVVAGSFAAVSTAAVAIGVRRGWRAGPVYGGSAILLVAVAGAGVAVGRHLEARRAAEAEARWVATKARAARRVTVTAVDWPAADAVRLGLRIDEPLTALQVDVATPDGRTGELTVEHPGRVGPLERTVPVGAPSLQRPWQVTLDLVAEDGPVRLEFLHPGEGFPGAQPLPDAPRAPTARPPGADPGGTPAPGPPEARPGDATPPAP